MSRKRKLIWTALISIAAVGCFYLSMTYISYKNALEEMSIEQSSKVETEEQQFNTEENKNISHQLKRNVEGKQGSNEQEGNKEQKKSSLSQPAIMLLYGMDKREEMEDKGRPDTLILGLIDPLLKKVSLISIPRDAYVDIPGYGKHKINTSFALGGTPLTIQTIEEWLEIKIDHFISIDFVGFEKLIDVVGGLEIDVDRDMVYDAKDDGTHIRLKKGNQELNGREALNFVRFRHSADGETDTDYSRMERQQQVLEQLAKKITNLRSLVHLFSIMQLIGDHIKTSLPSSELDAYIRTFYSFNPEQLQKTYIQGEGHYEKGLWYERVSKKEEERIKDMIRSFMHREE